MALRIAALASGRGSNVLAILDAVEQGKLDASVVLVASNRPAAPVLDIARSRGIPVFAEDHRAAPDRETFDLKMGDAVAAAQADTIVLAGYMRLLSPAFVRRFSGAILNIHPALLPAFPGAHAGEDALAYGVRITGVTVHFVDEHMDNGPVIIQAAVPVGGEESLETLMPKIHRMEHRIFAQALQWRAENRLQMTGERMVRLLPPDAAQGQPKNNNSLQAYGHDQSGPWLVSPPLEGF